MSDYYDSDELTRPGHVTSLTSGPDGARSACVCGWTSGRSWSMTAAATAVRDHINAVDTGCGTEAGRDA